MTAQDAINLIEGTQPFGAEPMMWADLGCGTALFSQALASLLPAGSRILCMDRDMQYLKENVVNDVRLDFVVGDFLDYDFGNTKYDGFLLANSIHFVLEKGTLLANLRNQLKDGGRLLLVEYESQVGNAWVPYPIPFEDLVSLSLSLGFRFARKLGEYDSIYGAGTMYSCELRM